MHAEEEAAALNLYRGMRGAHPRRRQVLKAMDLADRSCLSQLVRDINSVNVLISDAPESIEFQRRRWPRLLGIAPETLAGGLDFHPRQPDAESWAAKAARPAEEEESPTLRFRWEVIESPKALGSQWLVALHPGQARYDSEMGLQLGEPWRSPPELDYVEKAPLPRYTYRCESWLEHARKVAAAMRAMHAANRCGAERAARLSGFSSELIRELLELSATLHDVGKLQPRWQEAVWRWQSDLDLRLGLGGRTREFLAHADFDPARDWKLQRDSRYRRPNHAVEGALAVLPSLADFLRQRFPQEARQPVLAAFFGAIAHHHGARVVKPTSFEIAADAAAVLGQALNSDCISLTLTDAVRSPQLLELMERPPGMRLRFAQDDRAWPLFALLCRRLRLADQTGTRWGSGSGRRPSPQDAPE